MNQEIFFFQNQCVTGKQGHDVWGSIDPLPVVQFAIEHCFDHVGLKGGVALGVDRPEVGKLFQLAPDQQVLLPYGRAQLVHLVPDINFPLGKVRVPTVVGLKLNLVSYVLFFQGVQLLVQLHQIPFLLLKDALVFGQQATNPFLYQLPQDWQIMGWQG